MDRDFKGVWIPKEIWLCKDLSALDRVLYAEIDSLDNENHCSASNEYFAEFCGCGVATITRSIQKLIDKGYIEQVSFDGRHRVIKVKRETNQIDESPSSKRLANNIDNNTTNSNVLSKDNTLSDSSDFDSHMYSKSDFLGSAKKKTRKPRKSLYDQCIDENCIFSQEMSTVVLLNKYLSVRLAMKEKPLYGINQWKGLLNKLSNVIAENPGMSYEDVINQSIERGYASFYPIAKSVKKRDNFSEGDGLSCEQATDTADERKAKLEKEGRRAEF